MTFAIVPPRRSPSRLLACLDLQRISICANDDRPFEIERCLANCRRVLAHARAHGWAVAHVHQRLDGLSSQIGEGMGWPIAGLGPLPSEPVVERPGVSAFSSPAFSGLVESYGFTEMVIIGFSIASSCLATALTAHDRNISTTLVDDAVAATPLETQGLNAVDTIAKGIAAPYVAIRQTKDLLGATRHLYLVS